MEPKKHHYQVTLNTIFIVTYLLIAPIYNIFVFHHKKKKKKKKATTFVLHSMADLATPITIDICDKSKVNYSLDNNKGKYI